MGLGSAANGAVPLRRARELAQAARDALQEGQDPLALKEAEAARTNSTSFGVFADQFVEMQAASFRNEKHIAQWRMTLTEYAAPIRDKQLAAITTEDVLGILEPIWLTKPETASRLRGRIERVLDAAKAKGLRAGENPAAWRGHLELLLPRRKRLTRGHHAAMPYPDVPEFMAKLSAQPGLAARALEFLILGACRSGEVRYLAWSEIDWDQRVWTIPGERMKAGRPHRVPLTDGMLIILEELQQLGLSREFAFVGPNKQRPFSDMALSAVLRRMKIEKCTVHGFRSSFRDWAGDATDFPREVAEAALAHVVGDATERAYRRGDAFEKRRSLMDAWARYCISQTVN
jgi:integrase